MLLHHGTEAPFCGGLLGQKDDGVYCCRLVRPAALPPQDQVRERHRLAELLRAVRRGPRPARCATPATAWCASRRAARAASSHQGHVFPDGPRPDPPALLHQLGLAAVREDRRCASRSAAPGRQAAGRARRLRVALNAAGATKRCVAASSRSSEHLLVGVLAVCEGGDARIGLRGDRAGRRADAQVVLHVGDAKDVLGLVLGPALGGAAVDRAAPASPPCR